jgi:excisionase family DNA binding protein
MTNTPKMLTAGEVGAEFGVCAKTIIRWSMEGKLPATIRTPGGHRRWSREAVAAYIARRASTGGQEAK